MPAWALVFFMHGVLPEGSTGVGFEQLEAVVNEPVCDCDKCCTWRDEEVRQAVVLGASWLADKRDYSEDRRSARLFWIVFGYGVFALALGFVMGRLL